MIYLNTAATGIPHSSVLNAAWEYAMLYQDNAFLSDQISDILWQKLDTARKAVAEFIHCDKEEVALVQSTSHALGILAQRLPLSPKDNILICDMEYQASTVCWKQRQKEIGFEIRSVKTRNGVITVNNFEEYIDDNTKVILIAAVQEINGFRADIKEISRLSKKYNCLLIVDGIQEAGMLYVNVKDPEVDFYCVGGKKWIGNPFGMGFLYIKRDHLKWLKPGYYSYTDIQVSNPYNSYIAYLEDPRRNPFDRYSLKNNASVFEIGGFGNYLGAMGLARAIQFLCDKGIQEIEAHNLALSKRMYDGLRSFGMVMASSDNNKNLSAIVSFNFGLKNCDVSKERLLVKYLEQMDIRVSLRCSTNTGGIRTSMHYYNTMEEVGCFLDTLYIFLGKSGL